MWTLQSVDNPTSAPLWFSDGEPINATRGGSGTSSRLIVGGQGFIDFTDFQNGFPTGPVMDFVNLNDATLDYTPNPEIAIGLTLPGNGTFTATNLANDVVVSGTIKPFPVIDPDDVAFVDLMIAEKYIPYQDIPDAPGKTVQQIQALGLQYFPYTASSFQLAMCLYDWTTASFTRMVLMKIFQYTDIGTAPYPLDLDSIADAIWESNWGTYTPQNADYMHSFMMTPASSLADVQAQLNGVWPSLYRLSQTENRVLAAAFASMPRTSVVAKPQLYSGQMDIYQLGMAHFGIEFLQCPLNAGPAGVPLEIPFADAIATYIVPGATITTKMVWSFGDSMDEAMQYQNGIVLVANPAPGSSVWEAASYITPLSDDPTKIEYTFAPGTGFLVQSVEPQQVNGKQVWVITLQVQSLP